MAISNKSNVKKRSDKTAPLTQVEVDQNFQEVRNVIDDATNNENALADYKQTNDTRVADIEDTRAITYSSVADMVSDPDLEVGSFVRTAGYHTSGDGGGNDYEIVAGGTGTADGGSFIDLDNGLQARGLFLCGVVTPAQFGVIGDGSNEYDKLTSTIAASADLGLEFDSAGVTTGVGSTVNLPTDFKARTLRLQAVGTSWAANTADPDANDVGMPIIRCTQNAGVVVDSAFIDCGLTTIDPSNQNVAAAGILMGENSLQQKWSKVDVKHYHGYGFWVRGKNTDSAYDDIRLRQWDWGSPGWFDVARRTAYGFVNSSGDFKVSKITANYNKSNIHVLSGAFTTQWSQVHPYNGSDEAAALDNITVYGGGGQQFTDVYLDNGGIVLKTFDHQFANIRTIRTENSAHYNVFTLISSTPGEDARGLSINTVSVTVNEFISYQTEGSGTWAPRLANNIANIYRRNPKGDGRVGYNAYPEWGLFVNQGTNPKDVKFRVDNTDNEWSNGVIANRPAGIEVFQTGFSASINIANFDSNNFSYPAIRSGRAESESLTEQPGSGAPLFELWATASNGTDFGSGATQTYNGGAGFQVVATENWTPTDMGAGFWVYTTKPGESTRELSYKLEASNLYPNTDNDKSLGKASERWKEIFSANGTINTSDERLKADIQDIPDVVLDAWATVPKRMYRWRDAIESKGEDARWHIGVIAQDVVAAFERHGLDAQHYGVLCFDAWPEQVIHHPADMTPELNEAGEQVMTEKLDDAGNVVTQLQDVQQDDGSIVRQHQPVMVPKMRVLREAYDEVLPAGERYGIRYSEAQQLDAALVRRELEWIKSRLS